MYISKGNKKMGSIASVSLPSVVTCKICECNRKCYAKRMENRWKNVKESYQNNLETLQNDPEKYWKTVENAILKSDYFRFHVSGDIPDMDYFERMVDVAKRNKHCEILCFTKKYELVNEYVMNGGCVPNNLHIIFSRWRGLEMNNMFRFPEAHVAYRDGTTTASENAKKCGGNCTECASVGTGCWTLRRGGVEGHGEQIVFAEH